MKKFFTLVVLALMTVCCTMEYDDTGLRDLINGLDNRISKLENDISALQSAIGDGKFVRKVEEYKDPDTGRTTGITVTYTDGNVVHFNIVPTDPSEGPVFSVIRNGAGQLVWAVDGVAIKVDGEEVPVYQTPVFSIDEEGNLIVEVNGKKTNLGPVVSDDATGGATLQDGIFTDLAVTDDAVVLTLSDGTTVNIPFAEAFKLNIETTVFEYETMDPITIPYTVSAKTAGTEVNVSGYNPKAFKVEVDDANIVITPLKLTESAVLLAYADSKVGLTSFVNIVINSAIEEGPKNLGKKGTANSYLVYEAGEYKFPLVKGNTEESVGDVAKAALLWETWNNQEVVTPNSVIASVDYVDGFITFATPSTLKPGNALIAALDANDEVLWSWHIWIPETDIVTANFGGIMGVDMMDRNLGALVATVAGSDPVDPTSYGMMYQWGRKDPFTAAAEFNGEAPATYYGVPEVLAEGQITLEESIADPRLLGHINNGDWCLTPNNELWADAEKTIYDPCPPGYRVPKKITANPFWSSNLTAQAGWGIDSAAGWLKLGSPEASVFPIAGYRDDYGVDALAKVGVRTLYWTSQSSDDAKGPCADLRYDKGTFQFGSAPKARLGSVRCTVE